MAAKTDDTASIDNPNDGESLIDKEILTIGGNDGARIPPTYLYNTGSEQSTGTDQEAARNRTPATEDQLGPLPPNWEKAYTDTGEVYFIEYVCNIVFTNEILIPVSTNVI